VVHATEKERGDSSQILTAATYLRTVYRHVFFAIPPSQPHLLEDILPLTDKFIIHIHRNRLGKASLLLNMPELRPHREKGMLAVSAWHTNARMGDLKRIEENLGWNVASMISSDAPHTGIDRVARTIAKMRVGLAWGGGTARGWALAGIANALETIGVPMDLFAGTSAGALGAAVYGLSLNYQEADARMRQILPYLQRTTRLLPPLTISSHSLLRQGWWNDLIKTFVEDLTFDDMLLPFAAVALDLRTGLPKVFTEGLLWQAIRASSSIPVLAPPMIIEGRAYADGGVVNAVPLDVVSDMGADILIGIDLTGSERNAEDWGKDSTPNMLGTLTRTINVAYNTSASRTLPLAQVLIRPSLRAAAVYDVRVMDEFIAEGERATYAALPEFQKVLKWLA
jgi:NTE family protein